MNKLSFFSGVRSVPSTWQPCHVLEIVCYLKSRGYNYELYKEINVSKYVLVNKNAVMFFRNCKELCESLIEIYFEEKNQEEIEFIKSRNEKAKKNSMLLGGLYERN